MEDYTSEDLLVIMSMQEDDRGEAEAAFREFHRRFKDFMWAFSYKLCEGMRVNRKQVAQDIFQNTLLVVYQKADVFKRKTENVDEDVKAWLVGISRNQLKQYIDKATKEKRSLVFLDKYPEVEESVKQPDEVEPLVIDKKILENALLTVLNDKERDILMTYLNFEDRHGLPKETRDSICQMYGLLPDSLRKIKERAIKKLREYLEKTLEPTVLAKFK